jgi:hypothetical protein
MATSLTPVINTYVRDFLNNEIVWFSDTELWHNVHLVVDERS